MAGSVVAYRYANTSLEFSWWKSHLYWSREVKYTDFDKVDKNCPSSWQNFRIEIDPNAHFLQKPHLASDNYGKYQFNCFKKMLDA